MRSASGFFSGNDFAGPGSYEAPLKLALLSPRKSRTKRSVSVSSTATTVAREDSPTKEETRAEARLEEMVEKQAAKLQQIQFEAIKAADRLRKLEAEASELNSLRKAQRSTRTTLKVNFSIDHIEFCERLNTSQVNCHEVFAVNVAGLRMAVKRATGGRCTQKDEENLQNEARIMRDLPPNKHLLRYFFDTVIDDQLHIFVEYRKGTVRDFLDQLNGRDERLRPETCLLVALHTARGLRSLHATEILHRDIKCGNLFYNCDAQGDISSVAIGDFDVSYDMNSAVQPSEVIGTSSFMAPEVLAGEEYSYEADVYSFGCVLFELMTGSVPWFGIKGMVSRVLLGERPQVAELIQLLNPALYALFLRCTAHDPQDRPELNAIIDELSGGLQVSERSPVYRLHDPYRKVSA